MATSRFIQAAIKALDHTVQNNPHCICSIDFKNSQALPVYRIRIASKKSSSVIKNAQIKHYEITIKTVNSGGGISKVVYKIHRHHQRWWFRIIEETELDQFVEVDDEWLERNKGINY